MTLMGLKMKTVILVSLIGGAAILSGCEQDADRQIYSAQACLDQATNAATADECVAKIEGNESAPAYLIRCSADFVAQEFTGPRIAKAFQGLKDNPNSGQDPMATMMAYLVFAKTAPGHTEDDAIDHCTKSGLASMLRMAQAAKLATFITRAGLGAIPTNFDPTDPTFDPAQIAMAIDHLANAGGPEAVANQETVGNLAVQMNSTYCQEGSSFKDNDVCKNIEAAIATGGDAQQIGKTLLDKLNEANP
jgi:hypothetical protein